MSVPHRHGLLITLKQTLWLLSLMVVIAMLATACAPIATPPPPPAEEPAEQPAGEAAPTEAPAPEAAEPKILRVRLYGDIHNLDPAFQISENDTMVANSVMSGLVRYCPNSYEICNDLAESIEQSKDGLEINFKLKEGVMWHTGYGEVTTEDVKYSFERFIDPDLDAAYADDWATLDHVEIIDKYNGKIILKEPFAPADRFYSKKPGASTGFFYGQFF